MVEEPERQVAVHRLDPQRQPRQLHRQRIEVHAVDAALDDVAHELGAQPVFEVLVLRRHGQGLVVKLGRFHSVGEAADRAVRTAADPAVEVQALVQRLRQKPQRGDQERPRAHGRIAHLDAQDLLGLLGPPFENVGQAGVGVRLLAHGLIGQRLQGSPNGRRGELRPRIERTGALARPAPADEEPLARHDGAGDQRLGGLPRLLRS